MTITESQQINTKNTLIAHRIFSEINIHIL